MREVDEAEMGNTLDTPNTHKETRVGVVVDNNDTVDNELQFGVSVMQGWRIDMEDAHICETHILPHHSLFAVLDGHGGTLAANYVSQNLTRILQSQRHFLEYAKQIETKNNGNKSNNKTKNQKILTKKEQTEYCQLLLSALQYSFMELDREILQTMMIGSTSNVTAPNMLDLNEAGTTAVVVLITPHLILCANAGDSRAILCQGNKTIVSLSVDHKPDLEIEEQRIVRMGGVVHSGQVDGLLSVSRALGDFQFKDRNAIMLQPVQEGHSSSLEDLVVMLEVAKEQKVTCVPDVLCQNRTFNTDQFIVIACDGVWDVVTNNECLDIVKTLQAEGESNLGLICEELLDICLKKGSRDNMSVIVIQFPGQTTGQGGGVMKRRAQRARLVG